ncbi:MAG: hypothetical protein JRC86_00455 [Deltaproteobacteria bacterium]|nr:hypothetical protein [Deltaproteobacteria bacterium]
MQIIRPTTITDAMFVSSDVPETDGSAGEWGVAVPYTEGDTVRVTTTGVHNVYEALVDVTGGLSPQFDVLTAVPKWIFVSATNRWKPFDIIVGSQAIKTTSMEYVIEPGVIDSISLLNINGIQVDIVMNDPIEGEVYNVSINLLNTSQSVFVPVAIDWYTYFFEDIVTRDGIVLFDVPLYLHGVITITVTQVAGFPAAVGAIIVGKQAFLGDTQYGMSVGITDYSVKTADAFGNYEVTERPFSKNSSVSLRTPNANIDEVQRMLADFRATPVLWIGAIEYASSIVYGFYKDFSIVISYPDVSDCEIEIEGLT